jgi:hypothetical protein
MPNSNGGLPPFVRKIVLFRLTCTLKLASLDIYYGKLSILLSNLTHPGIDIRVLFQSCLLPILEHLPKVGFYRAVLCRAIPSIVQVECPYFSTDLKLFAVVLLM